MKHPYGEEVKSSKLTTGQVLLIKQDLANGMSQRKIAKKYGVGQTIICSINRRVYWKHV